ncbi:uncharacterized threonine-rich GPI-anchored glycoprotein PJ4664.02-like, partial [Limulus polyphemus]|uniref:Uncharacterized threonine-rich GPI-anchored glycoprotein PJ4664.02-like n=1 Tax=Limulus polyphemus TaxID=6850 RepID=A0ABM1BGP0_LIMPO
CLQEEFQCLTDNLCIPESRVHDGWKDCPDGSDEECGEDQHRCGCGFPRCLDRQHVGDGISDCLDGSDEDISQKKSSYMCPDEDQLQDLLAVERKKRDAEPQEEEYIEETVNTAPDESSTANSRIIKKAKKYRTFIRRVKPSGGLNLQGSRPIVIRRTRINQASPSVLATPLRNTNLESTQLSYDRVFSSEEIDDVSVPKPIRRVVRLKRPLGQSEGNRRIIVTRRVNPQSPVGIATSVKARGPVLSYVDHSNDLDVETFHKKLYSTVLPLTFYTTFTYFTTFLQGTVPVYTSREAVRFSISLQTPNPAIVSVIEKESGYITRVEDQKITPIGSRSREGTITIVNLGSRVQIFNNDIQRAIFATTSVPTFGEQKTIDVSYLDSIAKTYYTHFTYFYTFYDSLTTQKSTRTEVISSTATPDEELLKYSFVNTIDSNGFLTVRPVNRIVNLGSTAVDGTTTHLRLSLQTLLKLDGFQNGVLRTAMPTDALVPSQDSGPILASNYMQGRVETSQQDYLSLEHSQLKPSYFSAEDASFSNQRSLSVDVTPEIPSRSETDTTLFENKPRVRVVTSIIRRTSGALKSRTFPPRPGVRVRVKPATSKLKITSFLTDENQPTTLSDLYPNQRNSLFHSTKFLIPSPENVVATPEFDNKLAEASANIVLTPFLTSSSDDSIESISTLNSAEFGTTPANRKRLKITVRRPIAGVRTTRTNARFVLPSRLDVTSRPKYYVVTRTNPLGIVQPSRRPYVKVSRRLRTFITTPSLRNKTDDHVSSSSSIKSVVLTFFTTTTFTVPYTVGDETLYTTVEETNSRITTQPVGQSSSVEATSSLDYPTDSREDTPSLDPIQGNSINMLHPDVLTPELDSDSDESLNLLSSLLISTEADATVPTFTPEELFELENSINNALKSSSPQVITTSSEDQSLLITNTLDGSHVRSEESEIPKDISSEPLNSDNDEYNLKTLFTTFTLYTTLFSGSSPIVSSFEKVVSEVVTFPVTEEIFFLSTPSLSDTRPLESLSILVETSEILKTSTIFSTSTFFATLFNGTSSFVSPIEDVHSEVYTITEPVTFTRTLSSTSTPLPTPVQPSQPIEPTPVYSTVTEYTTYTNFVTLFQEDSSIISNIEEVVSNIYTITLHGSVVDLSTTEPATTSSPTPPIVSSSSLKPSVTIFQPTTSSSLSNVDDYVPSVETYSSIIDSSGMVEVPKSSTFSSPITSPTIVSSTSKSTEEPEVVITRTTTQTVYSTDTHYITLFSGIKTILSSIEDVHSKLIAKTVTETIKGSITLNAIVSSSIKEIFLPKTTHFDASKAESERLPKVSYPKLVPSLQKYLTTYTYFTTLTSGTNTIVSSKEEVATSYITLFVPESSLLKNSELTTTSMTKPSVSYITTTEYSTYTFFTTLFNGDDQVVITNEQVIPQVRTSKITISSADFSISTTTPLSESILTFFSTYTYYTTFVTGTKTKISSNLSSVTQFVTVHPAASQDKTESSDLIIEPTPSATMVTVPAFTDSPETAVILSKSSSLATSITSVEDIGATESTMSIVDIKQSISSVADSSELEDIVSIVTIVSSSVSTEEHTPDAEGTFALEDVPVRVETKISVQTSVYVESNIASSQVESSGSNEKETVIGIQPSSSLIVGDKETPTSGNDETFLISSLESVELDEQEKVIVPTVSVGKSPVAEIKETKTLAEKTNRSFNSIFSGTSTKVIGGSTVVFFTNFILPGLDQPSSSTSAVSSTEYNESNISSLETSAFIIPTYVIDEETGALKPAEDMAENITQINSNGTNEFITKLNDFYQPSATLDYVELHNETTPDEDYDNQSGPIIDLSDLLGGNANIDGNLAEAVKGILNKINLTGTGANQTRENILGVKQKEMERESISIEKEPTGRVVDMARNEDTKPDERLTESELSSHEQESRDKETHIFSGIKTIFFEPTPVSLDPSSLEPRSEDTLDIGTVSQDNAKETSTGAVGAEVSTSTISGFKTVFLESSTMELQQGSDTKTSETESSVDRETSDRARKILGEVQVYDETTILASGSKLLVPDIKLTNSSMTRDPDGHITITKTSTGAKTIFFPLPNQEIQVPHVAEDTSTRYVTSLESATRTLTLTTTNIYYTRDSPITVTSVFTTTIPPRTFVSTIIGSRTILGTIPEPTESVKFEKSTITSKSTTKVTTTTLVFNSITTTVVRTLVLRTEDLTPSGTSTTTSTRATVNVFQENATAKDSSVDSTTLNPKESISTKDSSSSTSVASTSQNLLPNSTNPATKSTDSPPTESTTSVRKYPDDVFNQELCTPECDVTNHELCKKIDGAWACECRPGYSRTENTLPCEDVKSYVVVLRVQKVKDSVLTYKTEMSNSLSLEFKELAALTKKAVTQAYKNSKVKEGYVSADVNSIMNIKKLNKPKELQEGVLVNFTVRVKRSSEIDENVLKKELSRSILASNYSVGNTELYVSPSVQSVQNAQDFDECSDDYNDCGRAAMCINQPGTFTCKCKDGYEDLNPSLPGRVCLGEIKDCEYCNGRGDCTIADKGARICSCHRMYFGRRCEINGLILAIVLPIAAILFILLSCCLLHWCRRSRRQHQKEDKSKPMTYTLGMNNETPTEGIVDRKSMIFDSSSEGSIDHGIRHPYAFDGPYQPEDCTLPKMSSGKSELSLDRSLSTGFAVPPMVIPRAKHHPKQASYGLYQGQMYAW